VPAIGLRIENHMAEHHPDLREHFGDVRRLRFGLAGCVELALLHLHECVRGHGVQTSNGYALPALSPRASIYRPN
jgi:hypothetical protein